MIFLSALGEVADKVSGLKLGAVDYITKPIQAEEVLARVETHLSRQYLERELRRSRDRLDRELASAGAMQRLILPRAMPRASGGRIRRVLPDEPACRRRLLRRAGARWRSLRRHGGRRLGPRASAAIVMAMIRAVLHTLQALDDPPAVLRQLNQHFPYLWESEIFATAIYGVLDARRRRCGCRAQGTRALCWPGHGV